MKFFLLLAVTIVCLFSTYTIGNAYILDDYFGVTLSVNSQGAFNMPWTPVRGAHMHENWRTDGDEHAPDPGPRYYISEAFDLEAMYLDFDWANDQIVYSIVTSMPTTGFDQVPWYPGYFFRAGDIRFRIGSNTYVMGTHEGFSGNLYLNPVMTYRDGHRGFGERGNPTLANSNLGNQINSSALNFSYTEYLDANGNSLIENGYSTYLIEGSLAFDDLGGPPPNGGPIDMTLGMSCNNDIGTLSSVPEPSTIALMSLGLLGLYGGRRRFLK